MLYDISSGIIGVPSLQEIGRVYQRLLQEGIIVPKEEVPPPTVPMDFSWARVSFDYKARRSVFVIGVSCFNI